MSVLKSLRFLLFISITAVNAAVYADVDDEIKENEQAIKLLEEKLDSMQGDDKALQYQLDELIKNQNEILARKSLGNNEKISSESVESEKLDERIRRIVKEELAKQQNGSKNNPYTSSRAPTESELNATKKAEDNAPQLPEQKSEAMAQYGLAIELYNKAAYKEAAGGFGRIIKTYKNDPIVSKAFVHLAFCLDKQGDLDSAVVVCEAALQRKDISDQHKVDCQLIRLRHAKNKGNNADVTSITNILKSLQLTDEQKKNFDSLTAKIAEQKKATPA